MAERRPIVPGGARRDLLAGVGLAAMNIPQLLGYARIAGMPPVTGLYTAVLPVLLFALLGSSRHLVVAADSATAAVLAGALGNLAEPRSERWVALAGMVALLAAAMLLVGRLFRLGFVADFLSRTVLAGFLCGVGLQVGIAMLPDMVGFGTEARAPLLQLAEIVHRLPQADGREAALAAAVVAAVLAGRRWRPRWPVGLAAVVASIAASAALGFEAHGIAVLGPVPGGLPAIAWPAVSWRETLVLLPTAASCVVLIIAQSSATARSYALRHGEGHDANADLLGLAAANAAAGMSGTFVVNGSPTQTAMAAAAGARSQLAQAAFAAVATLVLVALTGVLHALPRCVLAAVVFTIAVQLVDLRGLWAIRRESPGEFGLAVLTAAAVVGVGVEPGILLAVGLSLLRHVRHSYQPHSGLMVRGPEGEWISRPVASGATAEPAIAVYRFGADLFYANEQRFCDELRTLVDSARSPLRAVVVDASAISDLDYSAAMSLRSLVDDLRARGVRLVFGRVSDGLRSDMVRHRIAEALGAAHLHASLHEALADARGERR
jgi:high affinity sulfate transporter 1